MTGGGSDIQRVRAGPAVGPGIPAAVYASFVTHTTEIAALQAVASDALKLAEVLTETIAVHEDAREQNLGQIVDAIRSTAKRTKTAGIGAPFAKTLAYNSQSADKAVATKKKKAAAAATTPAASTTTSTPATSATPATTTPATTTPH